MQSMMPWDIEKLKQYNSTIPQALLSNEQALVFFSQDFGNIVSSHPSAVFKPQKTQDIQELIAYASHHKCPVTIRGNGLSQGGQSLPLDGGLVVSMEHFTRVEAITENTIWVEPNARWSEILAKTLPDNKIPYVLPYNCNLPIGGVLSVGGVGAASFKYGVISSRIEALQVIDGQGQVHETDSQSSLQKACLGGGGRFGVITKACVSLRSAAPNVKTYYLVYTDRDQWLEDLAKAKLTADYLELFCSPCLVAAKLSNKQRMPIAEWLYALQISYEYKTHPPKPQGLKPWKMLNSEEESLESYILRHDPRIKSMQTSGQWELTHPWYECFISEQVLKSNLQEILSSLPLYFANLVHVVPIAPYKAGFTMFPEGEQIYSLMIINPGVAEPLKESCIQIIHDLDKRLLSQGGKRYLSGYLGEKLNDKYWQRHFGSAYEEWCQLKKKYDPAGVFTSCLFSSMKN